MEKYETHAKGIRLFPGSWRPHYPYEHIAWVSPSWPTQDYIWVDFPEAIFTSQGLVFLSHVNPSFPTVFRDLPKISWHVTDDEIKYRRVLPSGIGFEGRLRIANSSTVRIELVIINDSSEPLENIKLQTCIFLRAIKEFSDYTLDNKYVHLPDHGWVPYPKAQKTRTEKGSYHLGWRGGPLSADLPVIAAISNSAERLLAMTWGNHTYSLVGNPNHPCMHADPSLPDLNRGDRACVEGQIVFHEGSLDSLEDRLQLSP